MVWKCTSLTTNEPILIAEDVGDLVIISKQFVVEVKD